MTSVVLLWTSVRDTWSFRHPILMAAHKSTTANFSLITDGVHCPQKRLWLLVLPTALPFRIYFPWPPTRDVIRSVARFRLRVHTLCFETATWNPRSSPACHLCEADDGVQDEQHVIPLHTPLYSVSLQEIWVLILINMSTGCFYLLFAPEQQQTPIFPA